METRNKHNVERKVEKAFVVDHVLSSPQTNQTADPVPAAASLERRSVGSSLEYFQLSHLRPTQLGLRVVLLRDQPAVGFSGTGSKDGMTQQIHPDEDERDGPRDPTPTLPSIRSSESRLDQATSVVMAS